MTPPPPTPSFREIWVCLNAVLYGCLVRAALWTVSSSSLLRFVQHRVDAVRAGARRTGMPSERIGWAVRVAGRRIPFSTCLVEALTAQLLLARYGYSSELRIGVARHDTATLIAHAWVEVDGVIVVGARKDMTYTRLPGLHQVLD